MGKGGKGRWKGEMERQKGEGKVEQGAGEEAGEGRGREESGREGIPLRMKILATTPDRGNIISTVYYPPYVV